MGWRERQDRKRLHAEKNGSDQMTEERVWELGVKLIHSVWGSDRGKSMKVGRH